MLVRLRRVMLDLAPLAGAAVRYLAQAAPGTAGAALISFGAWEVYHPAGYITAGMLLVADRVATAVQGQQQTGRPGERR